MIKLLTYIRKKELLMILISIVFVVGQVFLDLKLPDYMSEITILVQTPGSAMSDVLIAGAKMVGCALVSFGLAVVVGYLAGKISAGFSKRLRSSVFEKTLDLSKSEVRDLSVPSLITRTTNDVSQVQMAVAMGLQVLIKAPITAVWAITKISTKSWQWSALTAGAVGILLVIIIVLVIFAMPKFQKLQGLIDNINKVMREHLSGIRVVKAYNAEKYQTEKFEAASKELAKTQQTALLLMIVLFPTMSLVSGGVSMGIYWIGAYLIDVASVMDKLTIFSNMVVFSSYAMQIIMSFMMLTFVFIMWPRVAISAKRLKEVLEKKISIEDGHVEESDTNKVGEIEFNNVNFKYPDADEYILHNINLKINKGETVAFIGSTGSGKSTIVNLIPRFYDVTDGKITIDGINVKDYSLEALHKKLGYVSQKAVLFSGTIASNVNYGENKNKKTTKEDIENAIDTAQAKTFVESLDEGMNSRVAQGGTNFSGGQKQRLSIARALVNNPEILIFDDSFSALDYQTDRKLRKILSTKTKDTTKIIVAQRIGTILDADKIVVLDQGEIVGEGTHRELLKSCKTYLEIAQSQLSKEELSL